MGMSKGIRFQGQTRLVYGLFILAGRGVFFAGPIGASAGGGFVFDSSCNWGTYQVVGFSGGMGANASFGLSVGVLVNTKTDAPAATISDLGGPFVNGSVGAGLGPHGSIDGFYDPYSTSGGKGGGITVGPGVGGGFSLGPTNTTVTPNTLAWGDSIPGWLKPISNFICH